MRTIEALEDGRLQDRLAGWLLATGLAVFAFLIRVHNLGFPAKIVFDETYYAKDAWGLLHSGYERQWLANKPFNTDAKIADGDLSGFTEGPAAVVHPPLGKWLIAIGEHFFGMTPFWFASLDLPSIFASSMAFSIALIVLVSLLLMMSAAL